MILPGRPTSGQLGPPRPAHRTSRGDPYRPATPSWYLLASSLHGHLQVSRRSCVHFLLLLLLLGAMIHPGCCSESKGWKMIEKETNVTFRIPACRPLSDEAKKLLLGPAWDPSIMAEDEQKKMDMFNDGFLGDDPSAGGDLEEEDIVNDPDLYEEDLPLSSSSRRVEIKEFREEYMTDGRPFEEEELDVVEEEEEREEIEIGEDDSSDMTWKDYIFFKDIRSPEDLVAHERYERVTSRHDHSRSRSRPRRSADATEDEDDSKRFRSRRRYNRRRTRKKEKESKPRSLKQMLKNRLFVKETTKLKKELPWTCHMKSKKYFLREGVFPKIVMGGECVASTCFFNMFTCQPSVFKITVLQRDPDYCNPVPVIGNTTVFEERWNLVQYPIVVGCNCVGMREPSEIWKKRSRKRP